jgi:NAD(P)H-dependent FMN reductase
MSQNLPIEQSIHIVGICGSLRASGYTRPAIESALQGAEQTGAQTDLIDLRNYDLPFCDGRRDANSYPPDLSRLRITVQAAQGIILGTPVYHGSFSGVLKNALDLMGFREFEGKMIGLVGVSGGQTGAVGALNELRSVGRTLHAWVIPTEVSIPQAWKAFDDSGRPKDPTLEERLHTLGRQVARYAYLHSSERAQDFLRLWESAPENPGASR